MTTKGFPATVLISLGALGLIAFFGVLSAASGLGHWYRFGEGQLPFNLLGRAVMYGVVPMLAFIDIFRRKSSGRYLAILSLMCSSAVTFHLFFDLLGLPVNVRSGTAIFVMPVLGIGILLAALALAMGFNQKVTAFFDSSHDDSSSHSSNILKAITGLDERLLPRKAESSLEEQIFEDLAFARRSGIFPLGEEPDVTAALDPERELHHVGPDLAEGFLPVADLRQETRLRFFQ